MAEQALAAVLTELQSRVDPATGGRIVTATLLVGRKTYRISSPGSNVRDALINLDAEVRGRGIVPDQPLIHPLDAELPF